MTNIKILQRQFEEAAKRYPGLQHTIVQRSKEGLNPEINTLEYVYGNIEPDADYYVYRWGENIDREPNETGFPSWHFLSRPSPQVWNIKEAEGRALVLAEEAGKCLIALPELKGLTIDDSAERWFLALHKVYPCERLTYVPPETEFDPNIPRIKLSGSWREAEPNEAYIEELDNVFLKSAMLCGRLLEQVVGTEAQLSLAKRTGAEPKVKTIKEPTKLPDKIGRKSKYTPEKIKNMQTSYAKHIDENKGVKYAWNCVAEEHGIKSGKAAEMAVRRNKKKNK